MNETNMILANIDDQNIINEDKLISEVLIRLDNLKITTFYVVNSELKLIGVITEGDIRRYLISKNSIPASVTEVMNIDYQFYFQEELKLF